MKLEKLNESEHKYKYFATDDSDVGYYDTITAAKKDLKNFGEEKEYDERVILYSLQNVEDVSDLTAEDIVFEFYEGKLHYPNGRTVNYIDPDTKPKKLKLYTVTGSNGVIYSVKAYSRARAKQIAEDYIKNNL